MVVKIVLSIFGTGGYLIFNLLRAVAVFELLVAREIHCLQLQPFAMEGLSAGGAISTEPG